MRLPRRVRPEFPWFRQQRWCCLLLPLMSSLNPRRRPCLFRCLRECRRLTLPHPASRWRSQWHHRCPSSRLCQCPRLRLPSESCCSRRHRPRIRPIHWCWSHFHRLRQRHPRHLPRSYLRRFRHDRPHRRSHFHRLLHPSLRGQRHRQKNSHCPLHLHRRLSRRCRCCRLSHHFPLRPQIPLLQSHRKSQPQSRPRLRWCRRH